MRISRITLIAIFIFLFGAVVISRLIYLQILQGNVFLALAKGQQEIFEPVLGPRGEIFFHDKSKLVLAAGNKDYFTLYASPKNIKDKEKTAFLLSSLLSLKKEALLKKFQEEEPFVLIQRKIETKKAEKLKELNLSGIYLKKEKQRFYPLGEFASDILGFVNADGFGQYGVEGYYNDVLTGKSEFIKKKKGIFGFFAPKNQAASGEDLILTIDKNIQFEAEKILKEAKEGLKIEGGQIIVVEPKTGKILALADSPSFDPNKYQEYAEKRADIFQNGAIQGLFEPGSIFKPITMAAAINEGKITPETTYIDKGYVKIKGRVIWNYRKEVFGKRTMTEVLEKSINTGAVFAQSKIPHSVFLDYINRFGIFQKTGIDLQGEVFSQNKEFKKGYEVNFATASFGQGIEMTPLQIVSAYMALINEGKLIKPYIVEAKKIGNQIQPIQPKVIKEGIINKETAKEITQMLIKVVEEGYGRGARIAGYYIAGKTGTSQIPYSSLGINKAGYSEKTWQSFIGFGPAFDPKFLILVKLDNPRTKAASYSAAKLFLEMAEYIIDYLKIPPDYQL
jgi:cell division protein FtsI/penicillin-binding protein 2